MALTSSLVIPLIAASAVWVYLDATHHGIGKKADQSGAFNLAAGGWAAVTLGLWIVGFPSYLWNRKKLIADAKAAPIAVKARIPKVIGLVVAGGFWSAWSLSGAGNVLPACGATETVALIGNIVEGLEGVKAQDGKFNSLDSIKEIGGNREAKTRRCSGVLQTTLGTDNIEYTISWQDRSSATFAVLLNVVPPPTPAAGAPPEGAAEGAASAPPGADAPTADAPAADAAPEGADAAGDPSTEPAAITDP